MLTMEGTTMNEDNNSESISVGDVCSLEQTDGRGRAGEATSAGTRGKKQKGTVRMTWDLHKDLIFVGEVVLARPFQHRQGTRERGRAWQEVAAAMQNRNLKVDKRAVRDRMSSLMDRVRDKNRQEKAASGIAVEETDDEKKLIETVEEFIQEEMDIESIPKEKGDEEKKKAEGAEMRKRACETYGETRKRHLGGSDVTTPKRTRNNGGDTVALIAKKMELEQANRREEGERRRADEERRRTDEERRRTDEEKRRGEDLERLQRNEAREALQMQQQQQFQQQLQIQNQQYQQQQQHIQQQMVQQQALMQQQNQQTQTVMLAVLKALGNNDTSGGGGGGN